MSREEKPVINFAFDIFLLCCVNNYGEE